MVIGDCSMTIKSNGQRVPVARSHNLDCSLGWERRIVEISMFGATGGGQALQTLIESTALTLYPSARQLATLATEGLRGIRFAHAHE